MERAYFSSVFVHWILHMSGSWGACVSLACVTGTVLSRSIHAAVGGGISFFLYSRVVLHYVNVPNWFLTQYLFICYIYT